MCRSRGEAAEPNGNFKLNGNYGDLAASLPFAITSPQTGRGTFSQGGSPVIVFCAVSPAKIYNFVLYTPDRIAGSEQQVD